MDESRTPRGIRTLLLIATGFVAVTAFAGGAALLAGALSPDLATVLSPPVEYLEGSPFDSYLVPGLVLLALGLLGPSTRPGVTAER